MSNVIAQVEGTNKEDVDSGYLGYLVDLCIALAFVVTLHLHFQLRILRFAMLPSSLSARL